LTFKDLKKRLTLQTTIAQESKALEHLCNKPFWIWDIEEHKQHDIETNGDCCFNHIIGLPTKQAMEKAMFDYEKLLYDSLLVNEHSNTPNYSFNFNFKHKHLWVKRQLD
jgi:hypothetical protein